MTGQDERERVREMKKEARGKRCSECGAEMEYVVFDLCDDCLYPDGCNVTFSSIERAGT